MKDGGLVRVTRRVVMLVAVGLFASATVLATVAQPQPQTTRRIEPASRAQAPAPSPSALSSLLPVVGTGAARPIPVFPPNPGKHKGRTLKSLNGSTILLTGLSNGCFPTVGTANTPVTDSTNFQIGCNLTWTSSGLNSGYLSGGATANYTDYYLAPGATTATLVGTAGYAGPTGTGHALTGLVAGTYVFGTYDNVNNVWDAIIYVQVGTIAALDTYLDNQLTDADGIVAVGSPLYIVASGLTPQHLYVISIENTGSTGQCVYIAPNTSGTTSLTNGPQGLLCNDAAANTTGTYAAGDELTFTWTPPNGTVTGYQGTAPSIVPGTYTISVFDQTANQRVITRQVAVSALASATTASVPTVQFFGSSATLPSTVQSAPNVPARIAWNGAVGVTHYDSAVTSLKVGIGALNVPLTDTAGTATYLVTLSDPNGKVQAQAQATPLPAGTSFPPSANEFALPTTTLDFAGEFPTSTWTAGLFKLGHKVGAVTATPQPLGVRSVKILSYAGAAAWVPTAGGNQSVLVLPTTPTGTGYPEQVTFTNTGDLDVGPSNADPIQEFVETFPAGAFTKVGWYGSSSSAPATCATLTVGGAGCTQTAIVNTSTGVSTGNLDDSNGSPWTALLTCTDTTLPNGSQCGGATTTYKLTLTPNNAGTGLKPGSYITTPYLFMEELQGSNPCATTCTATNQLFPLDGFGLSAGTKVINTLGIQFGAANASNLTSSFFFAGSVPAGAPVFGAYQTGYRPRPGSTSPPATGFSVTAGHAVMPVGQPFVNSGGDDYFGLDISDQDTSTSDAIQQFAAQFPPNFDVTSATIYEINSSGYYTMTVIPPGTGNCPAGYLCWSTPNAKVVYITGTNCVGAANIMASAASTNNGVCAPAFQTFYFQINQPTKSFSYTDVPVSVIAGTPGNAPVVSVSKSVPIFVGTPAVIDSNAIGSFSLNSTEMLGTLNPATVGAGISTNVSFSLQNTTTALDPFPDYLDAYVVELPNNGGSSLIAATNGVPTSCASVVVNTANWSCIQTVTNSPTGYNTYWFAPTGCSELYNNTLPPAGSGVAGGNLAGGTTETANANLTFSSISAGCTSILKQQALEPGGQNSVTFPIVTSGATPAPMATPLPVYAYAHGANTNAWSNPLVSSLTVGSSAQATAGFANAGGYTTGTPQAVGSGQEPTIGTDTNTTYGDSYTYTIANVGSISLKSAVITIPYLDTGGSASATQWTITTAGGAPSVTGGNGSCTVAYVNPTASANGSITIGGASCLIATNQTVSVRFNAKSPGNVGSTFLFSAKVTDTGNNTIAAQETWFSDTLIKITVAASLVVGVNTAPVCSYGTGDTNPVTINSGTNTLDFGSVLPSTTDACLDAVYVQVFTNAAKPIGWVVYAQITGNQPATSAPSGLADEIGLRASASSGSYNPTTNSWITYGAQTYSVAAGAGNAGTVVMRSDGSGPSSSTPTTAYSAYIDLQIGTGTEIDAQDNNSATVVFTWISS